MGSLLSLPYTGTRAREIPRARAKEKSCLFLSFLPFSAFCGLAFLLLTHHYTL